MIKKSTKNTQVVSFMAVFGLASIHEIKRTYSKKGNTGKKSVLRGVCVTSDYIDNKSACHSNNH